MSGTVDGEDRVMAAAKKIVRSLNTSKDDTDDMLLIFSSFDNRLSNISDKLSGEAKSQKERLDAAEKVIRQLDSSFDASPDSLLWEDSPEEAAEYLCAVDALIQLTEDLNAQSSAGEMLDRAESAINLAMSRLEDEFRIMLSRNAVPLDVDRLYCSFRRISLSFASHDEEIGEELGSFSNDDQDGAYYHESAFSVEDTDSSPADLMNPDTVPELKEIADRMIRSGYEKECCQVYSSVRRSALEESLFLLGAEKLSIEEVQKTDWKVLDEKMKKWVQVVKISFRVVFSGEKKLCGEIFSGLIGEICFAETVKGSVMQLLNFAEAVAICKRSSEKLFRILDMYDALSDAASDPGRLFSDADDSLRGEMNGVLLSLGEAARGTFAEFEKAVKGETSKKAVQGGDIHPLTRYVMNYVRLLVDYSDSLNVLIGEETAPADAADAEGPLGRRLLCVISSLEANLAVKAKMYEDAAMQCVFLMNNLLYVVQKVKGSDLGKVLGDNWVRKRRGQVRRYATSYLRSSWSRALACLKDEGLGGSSSSGNGSGGHLKAALKERFKNFNGCFEELYRTQTAWKVPDAQLREELRISVAETVIPAYRAFMGRFGSQLDSVRHSGKYIKYTPEDIENHLQDFFEASPSSLHHLRRKS